MVASASGICRWIKVMWMITPEPCSSIAGKSARSSRTAGKVQVDGAVPFVVEDGKAASRRRGTAEYMHDNVDPPRRSRTALATRTQPSAVDSAAAMLQRNSRRLIRSLLLARGLARLHQLHPRAQGALAVSRRRCPRNHRTLGPRFETNRPGDRYAASSKDLCHLEIRDLYQAPSAKRHVKRRAGWRDSVVVAARRPARKRSGVHQSGPGGAIDGDERAALADGESEQGKVWVELHVSQDHIADVAEPARVVG